LEKVGELEDEEPAVPPKMKQFAVAVWEALSATWIVNEQTPKKKLPLHTVPAEIVPEIVPVALRLSPLGRVPELNVHV